MILTLLALFILLIGIFCTIVYHRKDFSGEGWFMVALFSMVIGGVCFLLCIGQISTRELFAKSYIVKIEAVRETFQTARADKSMYPIENAAIQLKIADKNEWIKNAQFWARQPLTNWFWSKKTLEIKSIR